MIVDGELKRVVDVTEKYIDLGDQRVELSFGPDDFMVVDWSERVDVRLSVVESWERGRPVIFQQNPVYLLLRSDMVFRRPRLVVEAIGYDKVGPLGRLFIYEDLRKKWSPSLTRVVYRTARKRFVSTSTPVIYVAEVDGVYIPVGFSMYYPVVYKLGLPAYIKKTNVDISGSEVFDAEKLFGDANDYGL
jgi:hypothetical protein